MSALYVCPQGRQIGQRRERGSALIAATPQRLRRAFHSGAALPGLYSGLFYSARSVRKAMGPLESPKSENPLRKQRAS